MCCFFFWRNHHIWDKCARLVKVETEIARGPNGHFDSARAPTSELKELFKYPSQRYWTVLPLTVNSNHFPLFFKMFLVYLAVLSVSLVQGKFPVQKTNNLKDFERFYRRIKNNNLNGNRFPEKSVKWVLLKYKKFEKNLKRLENSFKFK